MLSPWLLLPQLPRRAARHCWWTNRSTGPNICLMDGGCGEQRSPQDVRGRLLLYPSRPGRIGDHCSLVLVGISTAARAVAAGSTAAWPLLDEFPLQSVEFP